MLTWLVAVAGGLVFLLVVGALHRAATHVPTAGRVLREAARGNVQALREHLELDCMLAERALDKAGSARDAGQPERAGSLLSHSAGTVSRAVPDRVARVRGLELLARLAAAVIPTRALHVAAMKLTALRVVALASRVAHGLAVSFQDRIGVRLFSLRWAYQALGFVAGRHAIRVQQGDLTPAAWTKTGACVNDLRELDVQHVESYAQVLTCIREADLEDVPATVPIDRVG